MAARSAAAAHQERKEALAQQERKEALAGGGKVLPAKVSLEKSRWDGWGLITTFRISAKYPGAARIRSGRVPPEPPLDLPGLRFYICFCLFVFNAI